MSTSLPISRSGYKKNPVRQMIVTRPRGGVVVVKMMTVFVFFQ
jgi:hypothetical protein